MKIGLTGTYMDTPVMETSGSSLANATSAATHSPMLHLQDLTPDRFFVVILENPN